MKIDFDKNTMNFNLNLVPETMEEQAWLVDLGANLILNPLPDVETSFDGGEIRTWITFARSARPESVIKRRKRK